MSQPIRVALVGYGYWGPNYARIFGELPGSEVAAICEVAPDRRPRAAARILSLPMSAELSRAQLEHTAAARRRAVAQRQGVA